MGLAPGTSIGHYDVTSLLGDGGMGQVWQATDTQLNRQVALKILPDAFAEDPDRLARFQREAQILASLNHPKIAAIHGIEEAEGTRALVLELVEGPTLADRIAKGPIPLDEALPIAKQIAEALEAAHEAGVIHRDLKPANIKVREDGTVKVLDFGLAKALAGEQSNPDLSQSPTMTATMGGTREGVILGTAAYMSPEQARGKPLDKRTDIWSFGCVLYEMLTASRPFRGDGTTEVLANVLKESPDFAALPPETPSLLRRLLRRCLEKDPRDRLRDIADARVDLSDTPVDIPVERRHHAGVPSRGLLVAAGVLVVLVGGYAVTRFSSPDASGQGARQFVLLPPEGAAFGVGVNDRTPAFALSPDGRRLAFQATRNGVRSIWIQELNGLDAQRVSGTEGVVDPPAWSPDGSSLAFFADGTLRIVSTGGGTPITLAEAPRGRGITWNSDDEIVFGPGTGLGLLRVSASGGTARPVTELGPNDRSHLYPRFLPDGRHFLYLVVGPAPREGIYLAALDSFEERKLLDTRVKAIFASPGHLLWLEDGAVMARPFDPDRLELSGDPVSITPSVASISTEGRASYDVSPTGTLAFRVSGLLAVSQLRLVNRSGELLSVAGDPGNYQSARLSPDGRYAAVELHDLQRGTGDLWIVDLVRNSTSRFTTDARHDTVAVWSPDGAQLVFTGRPDSVRNLHVKPFDGSGPDEPLLPVGPDRTPTDWSGDGMHILYQEGDNAPGGGGVGDRDLWTLKMPERTATPFLATEFDEIAARFSPDGRWVAYQSNETGRLEVYIRAFPDATGVVKVSVNGGGAPMWGPGGEELFFVDLTRTLQVVSVTAGETLEVGVPRSLFTLDMSSTNASRLSTDGQRFLTVSIPVEVAHPITIIEDWRLLLGRAGS